MFLKSPEPPQAVYISRTVGIHYCLHALSGLWRHLSHGGSHVGAKSRAAATCSCPTHPPPTPELLCLTPTVSQLVGVTVAQELLWPLIISSCVCALIIPPCWRFLCPLLMYCYLPISCVSWFILFYYTCSLVGDCVFTSIWTRREDLVKNIMFECNIITAVSCSNNTCNNDPHGR